MHQGIKSYLDGNFFLAPLNDPRTILDIGYASHNHLPLTPLGVSECSKARRIGAPLMASSPIQGPAQGYGRFLSLSGIMS
jgi:hypothetical protein